MTTHNGQMAWWTNKLSAQRNRITILLRRLTGFGPCGSMNLSVFRKFIDLLDQVAIARDKEMIYLDRIEAMENQHKWRRENHLLRNADDPEGDFDILERPGIEPARPQWMLFLVFWYLFVCKAINQKKQDLTVD